MLWIWRLISFCIGKFVNLNLKISFIFGRTLKKKRSSSMYSIVHILSHDIQCIRYGQYEFNNFHGSKSKYIGKVISIRNILEFIRWQHQIFGAMNMRFYPQSCCTHFALTIDRILINIFQKYNISNYSPKTISSKYWYICRLTQLKLDQCYSSSMNLMLCSNCSIDFDKKKIWT